VLLETGAPAGQLVFEVTEGLLVSELDQTIARMHELAALGIRFSVDDFGTGYSNLAYLRKMPLYELKIDKSFMRDTPTDVSGTAIVQSIMAMADHLGLRVVAEGIETPQQAAYLAQNGNPCMQGYLFARPAPLDEVLAALAEAGPQRAAA
jgi:EAL domain-containing protein (putative c-di-GMP-specific phosphodiesterase class I)